MAELQAAAREIAPEVCCGGYGGGRSGWSFLVSSRSRGQLKAIKTAPGFRTGNWSGIDAVVLLSNRRWSFNAQPSTSSIVPHRIKLNSYLHKTMCWHYNQRIATVFSQHAPWVLLLIAHVRVGEILQVAQLDGLCSRACYMNWIVHGRKDARFRLRARYFFLPCQEVPKRARRRPACARSLRCSAAAGGLRNSGLRCPSDDPRPFPVASCAARRHAKGMVENQPVISWPSGLDHGRDSGRCASSPSLQAAERPVNRGAVGERLSRGVAPGYACRPAAQVAQGSRLCPGSVTAGSPSFGDFLATQEKSHAFQAEHSIYQPPRITQMEELRPDPPSG